MPLDEYVQWMLDHRFYDIDPGTGRVTNVRTGDEINWIRGSDGYPYVELVYSQYLHRPIRVHRFIGIKVWGVEAVRGKHVAHVDRIKHHSYLSNLVLKTPGDHNRMDGNHQHPKESWPPCAKCGTPDGKLRKGRKTPARYRAERFGMTGEVCNSCYLKLNARCKRMAA